MKRSSDKSRQDSKFYLSETKFSREIVSKPQQIKALTAMKAGFTK